VEILPERLKGKARSLLLIIVYSIVVAVAVQFLIAGVIAVRYYFQMGFEIQGELIFPVWISYLAFPVGFGLLVLFAVELLLQELLTLINLVKEAA
jgi:TRAP-type C4-dicarboxylate transport system permease small subunit